VNQKVPVRIDFYGSPGAYLRTISPTLLGGPHHKTPPLKFWQFAFSGQFQSHEEPEESHE
jgi:hypothetical protein